MLCGRFGGGGGEGRGEEGEGEGEGERGGEEEGREIVMCNRLAGAVMMCDGLAGGSYDV